MDMVARWRVALGAGAHEMGAGEQIAFESSPTFVIPSWMMLLFFVTVLVAFVYVASCAACCCTSGHWDSTCRYFVRVLMSFAAGPKRKSSRAR